MPISPNTVLGRYKIRSTIGTGGMGEVFLAEDTQLERLAAVKVLLQGVGDDSDGARRFVQEAKAASALNHPNILTIYEIGIFEDARFIASEFINGVTVRQQLQNGPLPLDKAVDVAVQVAAALEAAHGVGIVHRDIKPENIMLRDDGLAKVLDFGLAKLIPTTGETVDSEGATIPQVKTARGALVGTVNYMSPEQARGKEVDQRSDIWSLGVVFYEMITGRSPFAGETASDSIASILRGDPPPLDDHFPDEVAHIIARALQKDRAERYQNAREFYDDLKDLARLLEQDGQQRTARTRPAKRNRAFRSFRTGAGRPIPTLPHAEPQISSAEYIVNQISEHRRAWFGGLAILTAVLAAGIYFAYVNSRPTAIDSVAVMPFENAGGSEEGDFLSEGLSEALINDLSQLPQLKVIARTSTFKYKGKEIDPAVVAKELNVGALVIGRVLQRGDNYQINVELVNAENNTQIWGETYNRRVTDLQAVQDEIVGSISEKLRLQLSGDQQEQIAKRFTADSEAYQYYLSGAYFIRKRGADNVKRALGYFDKAIDRDKNFALAYVGRASAYSLMVGSDNVDPAQGKALAREAVNRALEIDNKIAEAHLALARVQSNELDWEGAEASYRRAIELSPSLVGARNGYAFLLSTLERHDEALEQIRKAGELDPLGRNLPSIEGSILYLARRYDQAVSKLEEAVAEEPDNTFGHAYLGLTYGALGRFPEAHAALQKVIGIQGETTSTLIYIGRTYALENRQDDARQILHRLRTSQQYVAPSELATLYAALDEKDNAFAELEKAFAANDLQLQFLRVDPAFDNLRNDPRFNSLLRRLGFPNS